LQDENNGIQWIRIKLSQEMDFDLEIFKVYSKNNKCTYDNNIKNIVNQSQWTKRNKPRPLLIIISIKTKDGKF
jgi:hypothetical protein